MGTTRNCHALVARQQLPGHYVGVMFHDGDNHLVAVDKRITHRRSHKVDGLGGASREDDLRCRLGVEHLANTLASGLLHGGHLLRHRVHSSMHIGLGVEIDVAYGVDHTRGSLRCGGVVEIYQRLAVNGAVEHREVTA